MDSAAVLNPQATRREAGGIDGQILEINIAELDAPPDQFDHCIRAW